MVTVDSKGRIMLPESLRERLGIRPGTEVEIYEADERVIVEPEDGPVDIISDLENMIESAAAESGQHTTSSLDARSKNHVEAIRRQAGDGGTSDE